MPVRHQLGIFRRLLAREPRLIADLDAAQPFDADIALPSGNDEAERITLLRPQGLPVLPVDDQTIVQTLFQRQAAVHARGVGAFRHHPLRLFLEPDFVEQGRQLDAGPFRATDHAMGKLQRVELRAAPFHAAVGGAFDEVNSRSCGKSHDIVHRQHERAFDQPVNQQAVLARVDVGAAGMVTLEEQSVRRDNPVETL